MYSLDTYKALCILMTASFFYFLFLSLATENNDSNVRFLGLFFRYHYQRFLFLCVLGHLHGFVRQNNTLFLCRWPGPEHGTGVLGRILRVVRLSDTGATPLVGVLVLKKHLGRVWGGYSLYNLAAGYISRHSRDNECHVYSRQLTRIFLL